MHDNLVESVDFLGGVDSMQKEEVQRLGRSRVDKRKRLNMRMFKDEYGAVVELDLYATDGLIASNKIIIPTKR